MRKIQKGMAFHEENIHTKFWIYKRNGQWNLIYPMRFPISGFEGWRIPVDNHEKAIDELNYALSLVQ